MSSFSSSSQQRNLKHKQNTLIKESAFEDNAIIQEENSLEEEVSSMSGSIAQANSFNFKQLMEEEAEPGSLYF